MARWSALHPWTAILLWVVFVGISVVIGGVAGTQKVGDEDLGVGESGRASAIVNSGGFDNPPEENILISGASGDATAAARDIVQRVRALPEVVKVADPVRARDGSALVVQVTLSGDEETADQKAEQITTEVSSVKQLHPALRIDQVGTGSLTKGLSDTLGADFQRAEFISLPISLLILLVVFGAVIAAGIPVVLALSAVGSAIGLSAVASHVVPQTSSVSSVILLMGMAVGVDYSLFYLKREREERALGRTHIDAITIAAETSGHAVVVSGISVVIAMGGLYLADDAVFSSLATGSIIVVAVAVLASLTVLPALLAKLGRWVDRPRVPLLWRLTKTTRTPRLWPALLRPALSRPLVTLLVSTTALILLTFPALDLKLKQSGKEDLPRSIPVVQALDRLTASFPSKGTTHLLAVRAPADDLPRVRAELTRLADRIQSEDLFAHDRKPRMRTSSDRRVTTLEVGTPFTATSAEATQSLERLRELAGFTIGQVSGAEYAVGGKVAGNADYTDHLSGRMPWVIGAVLLLSLVMMAVTFRSLAIAVTATVLNLLSAGAAFGMLVLVFQHTWAEQLLDFTSTGAIVSWLPLFLFVVLFGLSMDYHVFVVSRIREAAATGLPARAAVRTGITGSAGVVTSAAAVMVAVFSVFGSLSMIEFKQLGVGLATAILVDAVVMRIFVLPSVMALLGPWNWWPGSLPAPSDSPAEAVYTAAQPVERS
jgi:RND superfamily putative drug exporter